MKTLGEVFHLFVCVILSRLNAVTSIVYVENGKSVILNPRIQGTPEDILWTFNGNKVAEQDLTEFLEYGQFIGRSEIETITGKLTVHHMTSQDSGIYRSAIQVDGKLQNSENEVQVIDAVQEPNVTCILNNSTESKTLFCSVSSQFQTTFEWTGSNLVQQSGQELHISKEEKPDSVFTCTVKNEVSQKSTSFTLKDCPTDKPQPDENIILPVILAIICVIIVGSVAVAIYFFCQRRNKDSRRSGDKTLEQQQALVHLAANSDEPGSVTLPSSSHEPNTPELAVSEAEPGPSFIMQETDGRTGEDTDKDVNQALRQNHVSEDNQEQDINEDGEETENNEETEMMGDYKCNEDVNQDRDAERYEEQNNEDEDESGKNEEVERIDDSKFGQDFQSYEENKQEISKAQDLTGPAQGSTSNE